MRATGHTKPIVATNLQAPHLRFHAANAIIGFHVQSAAAPWTFQWLRGHRLLRQELNGLAAAFPRYLFHGFFQDPHANGAAHLIPYLFG